MIVDKDILKQYGLFDNLPDAYKNLSNNSWFVFYYTVDEDEMKLVLYGDKVSPYLDITLYRDLNAVRSQVKVATLKIGYFANTTESRDGLFYLFLRSFYTQEEIQPFYDYARERDAEIDLSITTDFSNNISSSEDFSKLIGYFCRGRLQGIMLVYDMVNDAYKRRLSQPLYGTYLQRAVKMIKYDAGILPEIGGTFRYMVIGEKARLTEEQSENLKLAKELLRAEKKIIDIYTKTGWGFSLQDGFWRTNVSDANSSISSTYLYDYQGNKVYVPSGSSIQTVLTLIGNPANLYALNYSGRLSDVLKHDRLYFHYPRLANLPLLYHAGDRIPTSRNNFYFSPTNRGGFILINGNSEWGSVYSTLLHEVQHSIQNVEGFATGGNNYLAQFVSSLGAESVRKIFSCIKLMEKTFIREFDSDAKRLELLRVLKDYSPKSRVGGQIRDLLVNKVSIASSFQDEKTSINFYLVSLIGADDDIGDNEIVDFLAQSFKDRESFFYEMISNVVDGQEAAKKYRDILLSKGFGDQDISTIQFANYQSLYGEIESRSVQATRSLDGTLRNYFYMTSWENQPDQKITIIDEKEEIVDVKGIVAAVETKENVYCLHFERGLDSIPFLHELGHIVHDALRQLGHEDEIKAEYDKTLQFESVDEFFVAKYLTYLRERVFDENLQKDFMYKVYSDSNQKINDILDDFFKDTEVDVRLQFLQELLKEI